MFKRKFDSLKEIFAFIKEFFVNSNIDAGYFQSVSLAAEELFTNMVKYQPGNPNEILIRLSKDDSQLRLSLVDFDVDAFDVTQFGTEPPSGSLKDRGRGGMGIHLVRQMMDSLTYDYENRQSTITVTKSIR